MKALQREGTRCLKDEKFNHVELEEKSSKKSKKGRISCSVEGVDTIELCVSGSSIEAYSTERR